MPPVLHEDGRTASHFYYLATRGIPKAVEKIYRVENIPGWVSGVSQAIPFYSSSVLTRFTE